MNYLHLYFTSVDARWEKIVSESLSIHILVKLLPEAFVVHSLCRIVSRLGINRGIALP